MQIDNKKMAALCDEFRALGIIPVVALEDAGKAVALGEALITGGLPCAEITFRTQEAEEAIRRLSGAYPDLLIGAGTVLQLDQVQAAIDAGAKFIVAPGFDETVIEFCLKQAMPVIPGVVTPTEINMALKMGLHTLKFFPAEALSGVTTLKAIGAVYPHVHFIPTGGINPGNLKTYLGIPQVLACGGSWLVPKQLISSGKFSTIIRLVKEAVSLVSQVRG